VTEPVTRLLEAREERQLGRSRSRLAGLDLLTLDELGCVPASEAGAERLLDVIGTASERTSVVVATNPPSEQWPEVPGSERPTGAALDRLTHRCTIVETGGEGYRLRDARRRGRGPGAEAAEAAAGDRQ
jgi:DNA replication protein DnaC